jgi:hypothetical protein
MISSIVVIPSTAFAMPSSFTRQLLMHVAAAFAKYPRQKARSKPE